MIGLSLKITTIGRYASDMSGEYYFNGSLREAIDLIDRYRIGCGDDWNKIDTEISNVRMLPEEYDKFADQIEPRLDNLECLGPYK